MQTRMLTTAIVTATLVTGTLATAEANRGMGQARGGNQAVECTTIARSAYGPWSAEMTAMVSSASEWNALVNDCLAQGDLVARPENPGVRWGQKAVVLISLGELPTTGWDVEIRGARRDGHELVLDVVVRMPSTQLRGQTISSPYHMIEVHKRDLRSVRAEVSYEAGGLARSNTTLYSGGAELTGSDDATGSTSEISWAGLKRRYGSR